MLKERARVMVVGCRGGVTINPRHLMLPEVGDLVVTFVLYLFPGLYLRGGPGHHHHLRVGRDGSGHRGGDRVWLGQPSHQQGVHHGRGQPVLQSPDHWHRYICPVSRDHEFQSLTLLMCRCSRSTTTLSTRRGPRASWSLGWRTSRGLADTGICLSDTG